MNYLLDKKIKRNKFFFIVFFVIILFVLFYFRLGIWNGISSLSHTIFRPALVSGNSIGEKFNKTFSYFLSKNYLLEENENLKLKLSENEAQMSNYNSLLSENISLKEILGRKDVKTDMILSAILSKPNQSLYDTIVIDIGQRQGLQIGDTVFALGYGPTGEALGTVPLGRVANIYANSSKVILFSNAGEETQVVLSIGHGSIGEAGKDIFMKVVGRGGGNFEMIIPRDLTVSKGDQVVLPGISPYVVGIVETIISDPRDPFIKALLVSPVNIQELKFVEVKLQK